MWRERLCKPLIERLNDNNSFKNGYQRVETERIIAFRSHWGYQSEYCNPASGNEKGGVEGELGWFRRNWLVPVPEATALDTLNEHILDACLESRSRTIIG